MVQGLGRRIQIALDMRGLSKNAVQKALGMAPSHLSRIVSGQREDITVSTLVMLARHLGVRYEWLLEGTGPVERPEVADPPAPATVAEARAARELDVSAKSFAADVAGAGGRAPAKPRTAR